MTLNGFEIRGAAGGSGSGAGIRTENSARNIRITDNVIHSNRSFGINIYQSTFITISGNDISRNEEGVHVMYEGEGVRIVDNDVHNQDKMRVNTPSPEHDDSGAVAIAFVKSTGNVVASGNRIWGNRATSFDYDWDGGAFEIYGASNVHITDNIMWDNENVLETGTDGVLPCNDNAFSRNVAYGDTTAGRSLGMFLRCGANMIVAHNTLTDLDQFVYSLSNNSGQFGGSTSGLQIVNNITVMSGGKIYGIDNELPANVVIDHNVVFNPSGYIGTMYGRGGTNSIATWRSWTGDETNGINADPQFINSAGRDFRLNASSPAIDMGMIVSGITGSYSGAAPDIGRFERS